MKPGPLCLCLRRLIDSSRINVEAGHPGQNICLAATSMGLGPCGIGAFLDNQVNRLVGVDGEEEAAIYLTSIGKPA